MDHGQLTTDDKPSVSWFLPGKVDFERHNAEVREVWEAYRAGRPIRVPVTVSGSIRNLFQNPEVNDTGYTFEDFFRNPEAQIRCQLSFWRWVLNHWIADREMGTPPGGWQVVVDFQNSYEAGWMGCPLRCSGNDVPDTLEILKQHKERLYDLEPPDTLRGNLLGRAMEFFEAMQERCPRMEFEGAPVLAPRTIPGEGTDGPFDLAYKMRGATQLCLDMYDDPGYVHALMTFITDNIVRRMKAIREWRWEREPDAPDRGEYKRAGWWFADDACALLSEAQYREFVFPYHKRIVKTFSRGPISMHLCGDASRHFVFMKEQLGVGSFDTGFPIDFGEVREVLGLDVEVRGGPTIMLLKDGRPAAIRNDVRRICASGIMSGGRFVLREANNLAPGTPIENVVAFYEAGKEFGRYSY